MNIGFRSSPARKDTGQSGFTIVELMVALLLGLILSAGIIQVFLANKQSQRFEQTISRTQENGRIALDMITQDLRLAGYFGCAAAVKGGGGNVSTILPAQNFIEMSAPEVSTNSNTFAAQSLLGFQKSVANVWTPVLSVGLSGTDVANARPGSDVVAAYYGSDVGIRVSGSVGGAANVVADKSKAQGACFAKNEIAVMTNCISADVFRVTNTPDCSGNNVTLQHDASGNTSASLGGTYSSVGDDGMALSESSKPRILHFVHNAYYVKDTGRKNPAGGAIYSLYRYANGAADELVEGIEFLKLEFGEMLGSGNIRFVAASDASIQWQNVVAVRVGILVQSYDTVRDVVDTKSYTIADQAIDASGAGVIHPQDKTMRQAFTTTVELRNRMQ